MEYEFTNALQILERTPTVLRTLLADLADDWVSNNEGESTWSAYDIVGHLIHGELTDWMVRVRIILKGDGEVFKPFDRFAQFENSQGKSLGQLLDEFEKLRAENLTALNAINPSSQNLNLEGTHPELGKVTLKQLLSTWVVHDLGHIAQVARVMAKQYQGEVGPWIEYLGILKK